MRIGKVNYLNALPLFYKLEGFEIVEGHPSELVKLLREGEIDAGIVSSVEYFFNPELYCILPEVSISSKGEVCSVLLLSNKPIERIEKIKVTPSSLTSRYLVFYILNEVNNNRAVEVSEGEDAVLYIGDEALEKRKYYLYSYDLGKIWYEITGLPFVFALFLIRKDVERKEIEKLYKSIKNSLKSFFEDLKRGFINFKDTERDYLTRCIDYSLKDIHLTSLRKFFSFMERFSGRKAPEKFEFAL